jgi:hypothetical protein
VLFFLCGNRPRACRLVWPAAVQRRSTKSGEQDPISGGDSLATRINDAVGGSATTKARHGDADTATSQRRRRRKTTGRPVRGKRFLQKPERLVGRTPRSQPSDRGPSTAEN